VTFDCSGMKTTTKHDGKSYLVTGANSGVGLEAVRQLSLLSTTKQVYLACRSSDKALAAIHELSSDDMTTKLQFLHFDASASKEEILHNINSSLAHNNSSSNTKFDGLVLNAGGPGEDSSGKATGPNHVLDIVQINLLGHIHLLHGLMDGGHLNSGCHVIYSGSESARGLFGMPSPRFGDSVDSFRGLLTGVSYKRFDVNMLYSNTKGMAALYMASWAQLHPEVTVWTVSPGGSRGTQISSQRAIPWIGRMLLPFIWEILSWFGMFHDIGTGARRYVDAVTGEWDGLFPSGTFVASARFASGPVCEQTALSTGVQYGDAIKQQACYKAIEAYH
jgi:NAD(P)-dependent dehydrogenase (short-subunit alcohol dehydrogenase family)